MIEHEYIPIPDDRASERLPIAVTVPRLDAWPQHRFSVYLDWNPAIKRWTWEMEMHNYGTIIQRQPAHIREPYEFDTFLTALFTDKAGTARAVTPRNLGNTVKLYIAPGPDSPTFPEWAREQGYDDEEIAAMQTRRTDQPLS